MSERRSAEQIRKELDQNARDALASTAGEKNLLRVRAVVEIITAEILLDIREHLDGIKCSVGK